MITCNHDKGIICQGAIPQRPEEIRQLAIQLAQQAEISSQIVRVVRRRFLTEKVKRPRGSEFVRIMSLVGPAEHIERLPRFLIDETDKTVDSFLVFSPHDVRVAPPIAR